MNTKLENFINDNDINITHRFSNNADRYFYLIIGCIEEIILSKHFNEIKENFMENYWNLFENNEENKLEYIEIYQKYCNTLEKFIENELIKRIPGFRMSEFEMELRNRKDELEGEIFDILATFTDFLSFKEEILQYKEMKEGRTIDFSQELSIKKL